MSTTHDMAVFLQTISHMTPEEKFRFVRLFNDATPEQLRHRTGSENSIQSRFRRFIDRADNAFTNAE